MKCLTVLCVAAGVEAVQHQDHGLPPVLLCQDSLRAAGERATLPLAMLQLTASPQPILDVLAPLLASWYHHMTEQHPQASMSRCIRHLKPPVLCLFKPGLDEFGSPNSIHASLW